MWQTKNTYYFVGGHNNEKLKSVIENLCQQYTDINIIIDRFIITMTRSYKVEMSINSKSLVDFYEKAGLCDVGFCVYKNHVPILYEVGIGFDLKNRKVVMKHYVIKQNGRLVLGYKKGIEKYFETFQQHPYFFDKNHIEDFAAFLVNIEIENSKKEVGGPISKYIISEKG